MNTLPHSLTGIYGPAMLDLRDFRRFGVDPSGVNDSTAGIQAAVNQAAATGTAATIYVPPGTYALASAASASGNVTAQVHLPAIDGLSSPQMPSITFQGAAAARNMGVQGAGNPNGTTSQFISTATSGWMFGVPSLDSSTAAISSNPISNGAAITGRSFDILGVIFDGIHFTTGANPAVGALHLGFAMWAQVRRCTVVDSNTKIATRTLPTHSGQVAVVMPYMHNFGAGYNRIDNIFIVGQYGGVQTGEHLVIAAMTCNDCHTGLIIDTAEHILVVDYYCAQANFYAIQVNPKDPGGQGTNKNRAIINMTIEQHTDDAFAGGYMLQDPGNNGSGVINYCINNNYIHTSPWTQNGGTGWVVTSLSPGGANP